MPVFCSKTMTTGADNVTLFNFSRQFSKRNLHHLLRYLFSSGSVVEVHTHWMKAMPTVFTRRILRVPNNFPYLRLLETTTTTTNSPIQSRLFSLGRLYLRPTRFRISQALPPLIVPNPVPIARVITQFHLAIPVWTFCKLSTFLRFQPEKPNQRHRRPEGYTQAHKHHTE